MFDISKPFRYDLVKLLRLRTSSSNKGVRIWRPFRMEGDGRQSEKNWRREKSSAMKMGRFEGFVTRKVRTFNDFPILWCQLASPHFEFLSRIVHTAPNTWWQSRIFNTKRKLFQQHFTQLFESPANVFRLLIVSTTLWSVSSVFSPRQLFFRVAAALDVFSLPSLINLPWMMKLPNIVSDRLS